ncbi:MAG: ABC transporter substrate-binding protein [Eubacterium sp.]
MTKKYLSVILAMALVMGIFSACSAQTPISDYKLVTETTTAVVADTTNFKLSYSQSDSLNPFESKTLNNQVLEELVFDSLFTLDENLEPQPSIASGYSYTDSETLTVTLNSGIQFSNGSQVNADSVVYSFNQAKNSPHWENSLKPISSADRIDDLTVQFNLSYSNPNAHNLLTFAIAYDDTDEKGYAIGSGKYKYGEGDGQVYIEQNSLHQGFNPHITKITLINITSAESIVNAVNIGNISYAVRDLSDSGSIRMQCNKKAINLNNMVYLGVNCKSGITADENIRKAISLAIDRETLVKSSYQGYAKCATSVFNPVSRLGKQTQTFAEAADISGAKQAIDQGAQKDSSLSLTLVVNDTSVNKSAATYIEQQLETAGFTVEVKILKSKEYLKAVKQGNFDIYLGETKVPNDFNLSSFFTSKGATRYGIDLKNSVSADSYKAYLNGEGEIGGFILDFSEELPFIPLLYRQGMICFTKSMHGDMQGYTGNYFSNIEDWYFD